MLRYIAFNTNIFSFSEYFSYKPEKFLKRKNVCVKGYISEHEGKTQMEIRTEKQIKIRE